MKSQGQQKINFVEVENEENNLISTPLLEELIRHMEPDLLNGSLKSNACLALITNYMYSSPRLQDTELKQTISNDLFQVLYGLKKSSCSNTIRKTEHAIEVHKRRYFHWLESEIKAK